MSFMVENVFDDNIVVSTIELTKKVTLIGTVGNFGNA